MSWKLRVLMSALLLTPASAMTLGLGEIRLGSSLNEPLSAEIDLVAATAEELAALRAELASPEVFQRYGLDRPSYLNSIEFRVGRGQDGRNALLVRSRDPINEPFVSFLVDVNWARGRLLREYTVLLDPPVLAEPAARPPEPVAAPMTMPSAPPAPAAPSEPEMPVATGDSYTVERGDTLYAIAATLTAGDRQAMQRMMVGLFRANPEAFKGNMNVLRAGAILRVPSAAEMADITTAEATSEVRRQVSAWRAAGGGAASGRLRLVTPSEGGAAAGTAQAETSGAVRSQIESLEGNIEEQRRLLELRNQELARLQQELSRTQAAEKAAAEKAAAEKAAAEQAAAEKAAAEQAAAEQAAAEQAAAEQAAAEAAPGEETAVAPEDVSAREAPDREAAVPAREQQPLPARAERSLLDRLTENWTYLLGAAAVLLLGLFGYGYMRRRGESQSSAGLRTFDIPAAAPAPSETVRLRTLRTGETVELERPATLEETDQILVEERPVARPKVEPAPRPKAEPAPRPKAEPAPRPSAGHEETISAEAALDLDQADPLAEADFHMAYGLYDQAVDLVRMALQNAPERNDLKLKLAEIHFVAGDTPQFLNVARDLRKTLGPGADWDRVVIMGRQLAPDESMFAGAVQDAGVDLSLEGGDNRVDIDLISAPAGEEGLDFSFGDAAATAGSTDATGENTALEFDLGSGEYPPTTTQEIVRKDGPSTVEMPTLELPSSDTPTVETLALRVKGGKPVTDRADSTAEMAIDDLGLDLGALDNLPEADDATAIATGVHEEATQIARYEATTRLMPRPGGDTAQTQVLPEREDSGATSIVKKIDLGALDLDVGTSGGAADAAPTARGRTLTEQLPQMSELEPVTMSEVGTKLDLARAYMDMGDPDGARNILQEVLAEGSASQKQEARRLIDSLPGA